MNAEIIAQLALEREFEIRRQVALARQADPAPEAPRFSSAETLRRWRIMAAKCLGKEECGPACAEASRLPSAHAAECSCT